MIKPGDWVTNNSFIAKKLRANDRAYDKALRVAKALSFAQQVIAIREARIAFADAQDYILKLSETPYPEFCRHAHKCAGKSSCQNDPNCIE